MVKPLCSNVRIITAAFRMFEYLEVFPVLYGGITTVSLPATKLHTGERGGSVVECRTPEREVRGSRPTAAVLCP